MIQINPKITEKIVKFIFAKPEQPKSFKPKETGLVLDKFELSSFNEIEFLKWQHYITSELKNYC